MNLTDLPTSPAVIPTVIPVSALNRAARVAIERGVAQCWVSGEISNLTRAPSGHWYFTLKDAAASVRCAMFRGRNQFVGFTPENGQQVEVRAQATLYEPRGEFQLAVEAMRRAGTGNLFEAFMRLKAKLEAEGLFAPERKRALPAWPKRIGIITSPRAAALHDVWTALQRRWPVARVILYPAMVQGEGAAGQLVQALKSAIRRNECEVLLLVRGGGSIEDLWAFNDEALARAIAASPIPVVSGVGHETDFTLADFVADLRAPTPTAAAELSTPERDALLLDLREQTQALRRSLIWRLDELAQRLDLLRHRLRHPAERLAWQRQRLQRAAQSLQQGTRRALQQAQERQTRSEQRLTHLRPQPQRLREAPLAGLQRLQTVQRHRLQQQNAHLLRLTDRLHSLNPEAVLGRGYAIARNAKGEAVRDAATLAPGDSLRLTFAKGEAVTRVEANLPLF